MIKLEEFVNEKLKVTKNSGGVSIKTTLRKFMAWFTGEDEFRINRFDLEDRNFISSDKSMTKGDISDFLYRHINDEIDVDEEGKDYRVDIGLRGESKSRLYDYSFTIDGKTFSIDARIFNDNELLSNCKDYIIEKLKVSKNINTGPTLRHFIDFYMRNNNWKWADLHNIMFGYGMWGENNEFKTWEEFKNFLEYNIDKNIKVELNRTDSRRLGINVSTNQLINQYIFEVDNVEFVININKYTRKDTFEEWFKLHHPDEVYEKLKVSTKSGEVVKVELRNFVTWYMYDDDEWDESDLKTVEFARNTTESYFGGSYKKLYEFICKHEQDIVDVREYADTYGNYYTYEFTVEDIPFKVEAYIEKPSDLLSKQWRILVEKLKVTKDSIKGNIKSTLKGFFLWYNGYETINDDFWDAMYTIEFSNDVLEEYFNDNINDFVDWFGKNMDDIVYFDEVKDGRENYKYTFTFDEMTFEIFAWVSPENNTYPFSKSQYIIRRLHEKLKVSNNNIMTGKLRDVIFDFFNIDAWVPKYFNTIFADSRKKYFDDDVSEMVQYFCSNRGKMVEYEIETIEQIDNTTELVELRFTLNDMEFSEQVIVEED